MRVFEHSSIEQLFVQAINIAADKGVIAARELLLKECNECDKSLKIVCAELSKSIGNKYDEQVDAWNTASANLRKKQECLKTIIRSLEKDCVAEKAKIANKFVQELELVDETLLPFTKESMKLAAEQAEKEFAKNKTPQTFRPHKHYTAVGC